MLSACASTHDGEAPKPQKPELGSFGVDLTNRDLSARPGDDFFRYANGSWIDSYEMPADQGRYGAFNSLRERSDERIQAIIEELAGTGVSAGSMEQKIADYFANYMDTEALNALGIEPLRPGLAKIAEIENVAQLTRAFGRFQLDSTPTPFAYFIGADRANPDRNQLSLVVSGINLPDRDYYSDPDERYAGYRAEYLAHIARMLDFAGFPDSRAQAQAVMDIESEIAGYMWTRSERRDRDKTFNPMGYAQFKEAYPGMDWDAYFKAGGIEGLQDLNVSFPSAMSPVISMFGSVPIEKWKSYLSYRLIAANASILSEEIDAESFRFFSTVLRDIPTQKERWERGVARVGSTRGLGFALGQIYVAKHFPEAAKRQMETLVENLRSALAESIAENDWMGPETKVAATQKLRAFRPKIGYPDVWKDLSKIEIERGDLFASVKSLQAFNHADSIRRLGEPTDREEWGMTPQTVNAYYNPSFNEIVFPAAILQPPFFDPNADLAVNYGGIGGVIGHEMGHGFDDQGSKSDAHGVQRNWWTDADRSNFELRTDALVAQYACYEPIPGSLVDGNFTLGENIGDLGGLSLAYRAYQKALGGKPAAVIDGLTGDQRFFLAWAQVWCAKNRESTLISRLKSDPHSPEQYRVNGIVCNMDAWYEAFDVQSGDAMYVAPAKRIRIW